MNSKSIYFYVLILLLIISCSKKEKVQVLKEKSLESQMIETYNEAMQEFNKGDVIYAGKKFNEVETLYPQSIWASKSILMSAYGYFSQSYYNDAINELERFIVKYKNHPQIPYAYYLLALCHYDQIVDEKRDSNEIIKAQELFEYIIDEYPDTDYARDANFKLEFINEIIASKEMYLARYYVSREKWIPAINRFKKVVNDHQTTIYVEEALFRLVELHYKLGLVEEATSYAALLGYNYQSSKWYEASFIILNKNYTKNKNKIKDDRENILSNFKKIFK